MAINLNELAREIARKESGKIEISIAQIKEIMKDMFELLAEEKSWEVLRTIDKYRYD
ncbi:MAG: hypothetical protein ACTSSP_07480 [Candidatus Asgardarchaeia archaeon]